MKEYLDLGHAEVVPSEDMDRATTRRVSTGELCIKAIVTFSDSEMGLY